MEFFIIADITVTAADLTQEISLKNIERFCDSIVMLELKENTARIGSSWGEFEISRQEINGGLRFALVDCPNALAWTITSGYPPAEDKTVIHLTINRTEKSESFIQSIVDFGQEWKEGLESVFKN